MKSFLTDDFLLSTAQAKALYHGVARDVPIIDYHCHLPASLIASDHRFSNLTEIWLAGDHYKWRAMRTNGVAERFCSGDATDREKFQKWAETVPMAIGNPLYHWTHLELRRPFGITDCLLGPDTAQHIWDRCNEMLATPTFSCRGILRAMKVEVVATTDDPADSLKDHARIRKDTSFSIKVVPTFRPDRALAIDDPESYNGWLDRLSAAAAMRVDTSAKLLQALDKRHASFHEMGCRASDHGLDRLYVRPWTRESIEQTFQAVRKGRGAAKDAVESFKAWMLYECALMDQKRNWVQQYHLGAMRNNNRRMYRAMGADAGFDSIGDLPQAEVLSAFLNRLDQAGKLTRTILYNSNPADNEVFATMLGNFQDGTVPGKIQYGSGWWFLDQLDGMERQLRTLSTMSLLSRFVGMVTDSRSFLSYTRHEYFRRLLCRMLGQDMAGGLIPDDMALIGSLVRGVCYENAKRYFGF